MSGKASEGAVRVPPVAYFRSGGWPLAVGLILLVLVDASLLAKAQFYPTQFANGVVCTCGQPAWVAYWGYAIYGVFLAAAALLVLGAFRIRRFYVQARGRGPPLGPGQPPGSLHP